MKCRMCHSQKLYQFLDLGFTPPADQFRTKEQLEEPDVYYPLRVYVCDDCGLVQLGYVVDKEVLYQDDYPYEASVTRAGKRHWAEFAKTTITELNLLPGQLVVDIGSNVGALLHPFKAEGMQVHGVDPAPNIVAIAQERGIETTCDFFNAKTVRAIKKDKGLASVITGTNVFAHIDDLHTLMENIKELLEKGGVFIFEAPYLVHLIENNEYDTIYHEHLSYISIKPLVKFLKKFNMEIFDIKQYDFHGGSIRVYINAMGFRPIANEVYKLLAHEEKMNLYSHAVLDQFAKRVEQNRRELKTLLLSLVNQNKKIIGVSAPAKGMTLLNYCGIGRDILDFVTEKTTLKIGRFTPGAHIPVLPDSEIKKARPDYALLLAWNFAHEIMENLSDFSEAGGKFIIPIPKPKIVGNEELRILNESYQTENVF